MFRQFVSEAEVVTLDGNGRFLISKRLQRVAGISQSLQFIGMDDTIEIWANDRVESTMMSSEEFGKALEDIMGQEPSPAEKY
jgi:MraZ protein